MMGFMGEERMKERMREWMQMRDMVTSVVKHRIRPENGGNADE